MNIKNNKRHQETIRKIEDAFFDFLDSQELSQIKVSDICKKVGINRSTFYSNFVDVYDLADKIQDRLKNEVNYLLEQNMNWQYGESDFLNLFQHIKDNQRLYCFYFKLGYDDKDTLKLYDLDFDGFAKTQESLGYHVAFFKAGFNAIIKKWLYGGCKESPQQMRDILLYEYRGRLERIGDKIL